MPNIDSENLISLQLYSLLKGTTTTFFLQSVICSYRNVCASVNPKIQQNLFRLTEGLTKLDYTRQVLVFAYQYMKVHFL